MARIPRSPSAKFGGGLAPECVVLTAGSRLVRIYDPTSFGATAISFRYNGPRQRFDHHEGVGTRPKRGPADDPHRGIWYGALNLTCCVAEVFGQRRRITPGDCEVAIVTLVRDLTLIDLVDHPMKAGTIAAIAQTEHHFKSQDWARGIYQYPGLEHVDGIYYRAAYTNHLAVALFERAQSALNYARADVIRLDDPLLRPALLDIATRCNLLFKP